MKKKTSPVIFGEVLFDVFPDGSRVLGGAPFNVAWHCQAFGLNPLFISRIGADEAGKHIISAMLEWGMDISGVQHDTDHATGFVEVSIENGEPSYHIIENSAWDFIDLNDFPDLKNYSFIYHGSLSLRNNITGESLNYLKRKTGGETFVDVNLRPPWWNIQELDRIITSARWIKLNINELKIIVPGDESAIDMARHLMSKSDLEFIVITLGEEGAIAVTNDEIYTVRPGHSTSVVDTVGAGDAFTSIILLGLHNNRPVQQMLIRAQEFASEVVGLHGATTQDKNFYRPFTQSWDL